MIQENGRRKEKSYSEMIIVTEDNMDRFKG